MIGDLSLAKEISIFLEIATKINILELSFPILTTAKENHTNSHSKAGSNFQVLNLATISKLKNTRYLVLNGIKVVELIQL